jgi:hypothetical protein
MPTMPENGARMRVFSKRACARAIVACCTLSAARALSSACWLMNFLAKSSSVRWKLACASPRLARA